MARPIRLRPSHPPPLLRDAAECSAAIHSRTFTFTSSQETTVMAAKGKPARKSAPKSSAKGKPAPVVDPALVEQVSGEVADRLAAASAPPPGVFGATPAGAVPAGGLGKRIKALLPDVIAAGLEAAAMARDGKLSLDEARRIGELAVDFFTRAREPVVGGPGPAA